MNRLKSVVLSIALQLLVLQFLTACDALPRVPPTTAIPTIDVVPAATATAVQPTNTPGPTVAPPTVRVAGLRIALESPDNAIEVFGLEGGSVVLNPAAPRLNPLNSYQATNAMSDTIYASSSDGNPAPVVRIDSGGIHPVAALKNPLTREAVGIGAGGGHLGSVQK